MIRRRVTSGAIIRNLSDQILSQRRSDDGLWSLPGGGIEANETVLESLEREILEETGWQVEVKNLLGIYSSPARKPASKQPRDDSRWFLEFATSISLLSCFPDQKLWCSVRLFRVKFYKL